MTWHDVPRIRAVTLSLSAFLAFGCGSSSKSASITITSPEKDKVLTNADDSNKLKDGLQYTVTATSSQLAADSEVLLQVEGREHRDVLQSR